MYRIFAAVLVAGVCASSLQAQNTPPVGAEPVLTLAEALAKAGVSSPFQNAASAGMRVAEAQRRVAALRPNPSIVAETENIAGSGIYRGLGSSETTVGLALPIELGGKRGARIAVADAQVGREAEVTKLHAKIGQLVVERDAPGSHGSPLR